jgi:hypothetical protein
MPNNHRRFARRPWWNSLGIPPCLTLAVLAGCSQPDQFAPACPNLQLLNGAGDISSFNGHGQDVTDLVFSAHITAIPASCQSGGHAITAAKMQVSMQVQRGLALAGNVAHIPVFVTIMDGNTVLQQQDYGMNVEFKANVDTVAVATPEIDMNFPVSAQKSAAAYTIYVGFRLTPQQLQYNRRGGG